MRFDQLRATFSLLLVSLLGCGTQAPQPDAPPINAPLSAAQPQNGGTLPAQHPTTAAPLPSTPPQARGARSCSTFDERSSAATGDWTPWSGCSCTPDAQRLRDREHCGMFPCAEQGCYVQPCKADSDCAIGICANFMGRPRGYCVTDDPK